MMPTVKKAGRFARAVGALQGRMLGLPAARNRYSVEKGVLVPTRDGMAMVTDHYAPLTRSPRGTVLVRTPYGRGVPASLFHGRMLAARGYHVLIQSCRGTGGSTGTFRPMAQETDDAQDAVEWLRGEIWFDGRLATLGGSYLGWSQWALMQDPPKELQAAVVLVGPHDFRRAVYGTGAFLLKDFLGWSASVVVQQHGLLRMLASMKRVNAAVDGVPLADAADVALGGEAPWFREWLSHPSIEDPYWEPLNASKALQSSEVPTLLVGGWQDLFLDQTVAQYQALSGRGVDVAMTVGPWTHTDTVLKAAKVTDGEALAWFDEHLAGTAERSRKPVRIFVTGAQEWRELPDWPPATVARVRWLHAGGRLGEKADPGGASVSFRYDPADPTPTVGGRIMSTGAGVRDNTKLEARPDVLTFTSPPLPAGIELIGSPVVELALSTDNPHTDVFVRLCDVDERGRSRNVSDAFLRLGPDVPATVKIELDPCAHRVLAGHCLRLQISGGSHPRYARNSGTDESPGTARTFVPSNYTVHCADSLITLPVRA